jgi:hypothetical protein
MHRKVMMLAIMLMASVAWAADEFSLGLETLLLRDLDPRTEARLARWNAPLGRAQAHLDAETARLMRGGQPGGSGGIAFRAKVQSGLPLEIMVASVDAGVELYDRAVETVRWPWQENADAVLPMEKQISLLLGRRLTAHTSSGAPRDVDRKNHGVPSPGR